MTKLKQSFTIEGKLVDHRGNIGEMGLYSTELDCDTRLYFVNKDGDVEGVILLQAEMSQGCGYISDIEILEG